MTLWIRSLLPLSMVCACSSYEPNPLGGTVDEIRLEAFEYDESLAELRLEGTFRVEVEAYQDTDATFARVEVGTAGDYAITLVEAEVEPLDPPEPLSLRAGERAVRRFRFSSVHQVHPSPSCYWEPCDGVCAPERRFRPSVSAALYVAAVDQEVGMYGESSQEQVFDNQPIDLGFPSATLIPSSLATSDPVPTACVRDSCYFYQDNGTVASLTRSDGTQVEQTPLGLLSPGSELVGASAAGAVVTYFWGLGLELQGWLPGGQLWSRSVEPADGVVVRVTSSGDHLLIAAPAAAGLMLDGQTVVEPAADQVALLRLDAHTAALVDLATFSGAGVSAVAQRADGSVVAATPDALVLLDPALVETSRIPLAFSSPAIHDAPGGDIVVVDQGAASAYVRRLSSEGALRWQLEVPWDPFASTLVADAHGGVLIAGRDVVTEIDGSGALVRQVRVACGGWIALHRAHDQITLVGQIASSISVDGTIRRVDPETYANSLVYATLTDP